VNFGLFPPLEGLPHKLPKREKHERTSRRALEDLAPWVEKVGALVS